MKKSQMVHKLRLGVGSSHLSLLLVAFIIISCGPKESAQEQIPKEAIVIGENLKVRVVPNVSAAVIDTLPTGSKVQIKKRSVDKVKIGRQEDYWYRIVTEDGLEGWTYGSYLSVGLEADRIKKELEDERSKKIEDDLPGKWFAATQDGTLYSSFIQFYSSGKIEFGSGQDVTLTGKYQLTHNPTNATINLQEMKSAPYSDLTLTIVGDALILKAQSSGREFNFKKTEGGFKYKDAKKQITTTSNE